MFDHYVEVQAGNPRWRRAMGGAAIVSGVTTAGLLVAMWVADKMSIVRVDPPSQAVVVVQMMMDESTATPPPPPPPPAGGGEPEPEDAPDEAPEIPEEEAPLEQPDEAPEKLEAPAPAARPSATKKGIPGGDPRGIPGGDPSGIPGGLGTPGIPGVVGGLPGGVLTRREAAAPESVAKQPLQAVKRNALYAPDCDSKKLSGTKAATFDRRGGHTKISFCVSENGKVVDVKTTQRFPGDPDVDRICRETVEKWRFKPFQVAGRAVKTCSSVDFAIEFE